MKSSTVAFMGVGCRTTLVVVCFALGAAGPSRAQTAPQPTSKVGTSSALPSVTPTPLKASGDSELWPTGSDAYLAWSENSASSPRHFDAYVEPTGGMPFRVNQRGTSGYPGGIDGDRLVFREIDDGQSDIVLFDLDDRRRRALPERVNTRAQEWAPTISGDWLLFGRKQKSDTGTLSSGVHLTNLTTGATRALATTTGPRVLMPGQVNGNWAIWQQCGPRSCSTYRYNLVSERRRAIPSAFPVYAPSIDSEGTAYFASSKPSCGVNVGLYRQPFKGTATLMFTLPPGTDIPTTFAYGSDTARVFFSRIRCPSGQASFFDGDVFSVDVPARFAPENPAPDVEIGSGTVAYQVDHAHSGKLDGATLRPPLRDLWKVNLRQSISYPLLAEDKVYVTVRNKEPYGSRIYALDAGTGQPIWFRELSHSYFWSNAAYDDGKVFTLTYDGDMLALDARDGSVLWEKDFSGSYSSAPTAADGIVYVGAMLSGGYVYAIDQTDGTLLWQTYVANGDQSSPALSDEAVFVSYSCLNTYGLDRLTGAYLWSYSTGCSGGGGRTVAYHDGFAYAREDNIAWIFDADDGTLVDQFPSRTIPALAGSMGYFVTSTLAARGVPTGAQEWTFSRGIALTMAPVVANGRVYVASEIGDIYALNRTTGELQWQTNIGANIPGPDEHNVSSPLMGFGLGTEVLIVPTESKLVALVGR